MLRLGQLWTYIIHRCAAYSVQRWTYVIHKCAAYSVPRWTYVIHRCAAYTLSSGGLVIHRCAAYICPAVDIYLQCSACLHNKEKLHARNSNKEKLFFIHFNTQSFTYCGINSIYYYLHECNIKHPRIL